MKTIYILLNFSFRPELDEDFGVANNKQMLNL